MRAAATSIVLSLLLAGGLTPASGAPVIAGHGAADAFGDIPAPYFQSVREVYRFFYGHTSHGSQVCTGLAMLAAENPILYAGVPMTEYGADLGLQGNLGWVAPTRSHLAAHPECNAVLWSWCGGASDNTPEGIDAYLHAMNQLESEFPRVLFVYMTGHLDGTGPDGTLEANNNRIRAWCAANDKVLFDFADIESWNPDGVNFPGGSDACAWCSDWCATHPCPPCADCAHSHCFNCYRKGRAFWWMMARVSGWQPTDSVGGPGEATLAIPPYPNPFGRTTTVALSLTEPGEVRVTIVDAGGRWVATLADRQFAAGRHEFTWAGLTASGHAAPAGVYFARITGPGNARTERLVLIR